MGDGVEFLYHAGRCISNMIPAIASKKLQQKPILQAFPLNNKLKEAKSNCWI